MEPLALGPVGRFAVAGVGLTKEHQTGAIPALGTPRRCGGQFSETIKAAKAAAGD